MAMELLIDQCLKIQIEQLWMIIVWRYPIRVKNGYRGFCGELNAKSNQKRLFLTYHDAKMTILTIKYGYGTTNRSIFNDPSE